MAIIASPILLEKDEYSVNWLEVAKIIARYIRARGTTKTGMMIL